LSKLEKLFPHFFYDIMVHLRSYLVHEVKIAS